MAKRNPNEKWMSEKLKRTPYKWTRQAQWGYRLFDFWNHKLGIAIEVDGETHNKVYDKIRDKHNHKTSGIIVLRVRNKNEADAKKVIDYILGVDENWNDRRIKMNIKPLSSFEQISSPLLTYTG